METKGDSQHAKKVWTLELIAKYNSIVRRSSKGWERKTMRLTKNGQGETYSLPSSTAPSSFGTAIKLEQKHLRASPTQALLTTMAFVRRPSNPTTSMERSGRGDSKNASLLPRTLRSLGFLGRLAESSRGFRDAGGLLRP